MKKILLAIIILLSTTLCSFAQACLERSVAMVSADWCPFCRKAKVWFTINNIPYEEIDYRTDAAKQIARMVGTASIPIIIAKTRSGQFVTMTGFSEAIFSGKFCRN